MRTQEGLFIVLEGIDGSGKSTQFKLLTERLRAAGYEVDTYDFPRYEEPSSYFVRQYLNGEYGPASEISPYSASLFYALDRFEAAPKIRQSLSEGKIVLSNRYAGSNMAHQGAKFINLGEQRGFFVWADSLEFELLGIPRPKVNIYLRLPAKIAYRLIPKKSARDYTVRLRDEHEADIEYLERAVAAYDTLCQLFPKDYRAIECVANNKILSITEINNRIWSAIKPLLPKPHHPGRPALVSLQESKQPIRSAKTDSSKTTSTELKDISILAAQNMQRLGFKLDYSLTWPPTDKQSRLNFYLPPQFSPKLAKKYQSTMNQLAEIGRRMSKTLKKQKNHKLPAESFLTQTAPLALLVNAQAKYDETSIKRLQRNIRLNFMVELGQIASQLMSKNSEIKLLLSDAQKTPAKLKDLIEQLTEKQQSFSYSYDFQSKVSLISYSPKNEFDLLVDYFYPQSNMGRNELAESLDRWTYQQKAEILKMLFSQDPNMALEKVRYQFDIISDSTTLQEVINLLNPDELEIQQPTLRYGYEVPDTISLANIEDDYIKCFDLILELHSHIQAAGHSDLASYAVLMGHRQRWQLKVGGRLIFSDFDKATTNAKNIINLLREKIAECHPLLYQAIKQNQAKKNKPPTNKDKTSLGSNRIKKGRSRSKK
jgi:dTMP kinase